MAMFFHEGKDFLNCIEEGGWGERLATRRRIVSRADPAFGKQRPSPDTQFNRFFLRAFRDLRGANCAGAWWWG